MQASLILSVFAVVLLSLLPMLASAVTTPTGISEYVPITLTNGQTSGVAANTPLYIIYNALAYQQYETNTLNNTELFLGNSINPWPSWMEGNYLNEQQQANTLFTSNTVMFWFDAPPGFLSGSGGAYPTNIIYLGWAGNVPSTSNTLWSMTANVGVAPQLTCSNPAAIATCSSGNGVSGTYGQYDDGNSIFSFYDNFTGTSVNTKWTVTSGTSSNMIVNNGITQDNYAYIKSVRTFNAYSNVIDTYGYEAYNSLIDGGMYIILHEVVGFQGISVGYTISPSSATQYGALTWGVSAGPTHSITAITSASQSSPSIWTLISKTTGATGCYNYNTCATNTGWPTSSLTSSVAESGFATTAVIGNSITYNQWIRVRIAPPGGVMPSSSFGTPTAPYTVPTTPSQPSASNSVADVNQYESFSTSFTGSTGSGGGGPYTYNWIISNSVTNMVVYSNTVSNSLTTNTFTIQVPSYFATNSPLEANVVVTDGTTIVNSVYSATFTVNSLPTISLSPLTNSIDAGQSVTFTNTTSYGTGPFT